MSTRFMVQGLGKLRGCRLFARLQVLKDSSNSEPVIAHTHLVVQWTFNPKPYTTYFCSRGELMPRGNCLCSISLRSWWCKVIPVWALSAQSTCTAGTCLLPLTKCSPALYTLNSNSQKHQGALHHHLWGSH